MNRFFAAFFAIVCLIGCEGAGPVSLIQSTPQAAVEVESAEVGSFFRELEGERQIINSTNLAQDRRGRTICRWLQQANPEIRELAKQDFLLVLTPARFGDTKSYALRRHQAQSFALLEPNKVYIQFQVIPHGVACPEYHGVIEPLEPKLLSFWHEGG